MSVLTLILWIWLNPMAALDAGSGPDASVSSAAKKLSAEDQEVISNLDLLEHMDESSDLEMMQELSVEQ